MKTFQADANRWFYAVLFAWVLAIGPVLSGVWAAEQACSGCSTTIRVWWWIWASGCGRGPCRWILTVMGISTGRELP